MTIRDLKDIIKDMSDDMEVNVGINELLEAEVKYVDSDKKEITLWMHLNKDKLDEVVKLDRGDYGDNQSKVKLSAADELYLVVKELK